MAIRLALLRCRGCGGVGAGGGLVGGGLVNMSELTDIIEEIAGRGLHVTFGPAGHGDLRVRVDDWSRGHHADGVISPEQVQHLPRFIRHVLVTLEGVTDKQP